MSAHCPICQTSIEPQDETVSCPDCGTHYHDDCWEDNGGCGLYGCAKTPETVKWEDHEIPLGYWGKEHKDCPSCGHQIRSTATRCRHCGETFGSATPQERDEYQTQQKLKAKGDSTRVGIFVVFFFCVFPFTAPFGLVFGGIWTLIFRKVIADQRPLLRTVNKISLVVAALNTIFLILMAYFMNASNPEYFYEL